MYLNRREFVRLLGLASTAGLMAENSYAQNSIPDDFYQRFCHSFAARCAGGKPKTFTEESTKKYICITR